MGDIHPKTQGAEFPIYLCVHKNHTAYVLYRMHFFLKIPPFVLKKGSLECNVFFGYISMFHNPCQDKNNHL